MFNGCMRNGIGHCGNWAADEHQLSACAISQPYQNVNLTFMGDSTDDENMGREDARLRLCDCVRGCYLPAAKDPTTSIDGPACPHRPPHDNVSAPTYKELIYVVAQKACGIDDPDNEPDAECPQGPRGSNASSGAATTRYYFCDGHSSLVPCPPRGESNGSIVSITHSQGGGTFLVDIFIEGDPSAFTGAAISAFNSRFSNFSGVTEFTILSVQAAGAGRRLSLAAHLDRPGRQESSSTTVLLALPGRLLRAALSPLIGALAGTVPVDSPLVATTVPHREDAERRLRAGPMTLVILEVPMASGPVFADLIEATTPEELSLALQVRVVSVQVFRPEGGSSSLRDTTSYSSGDVWLRAALLSAALFVAFTFGVVACVLCHRRRKVRRPRGEGAPRQSRVTAIWVSRSNAGQGNRLVEGVCLSSTHNPQQKDPREQTRFEMLVAQRRSMKSHSSVPKPLPKEVATITAESSKGRS